MSHYEITTNAGTYGVRFFIRGELRFRCAGLTLTALRGVIRNARSDGAIPAQRAEELAVAELEQRMGV